MPPYVVKAELVIESCLRARGRAPTRGASLLGHCAHFHTRALHAVHSCPSETCSSAVATCGTSDGARLTGTSLETNVRACDSRYSPDRERAK